MNGKITSWTRAIQNIHHFWAIKQQLSYSFSAIVHLLNKSVLTSELQMWYQKTQKVPFGTQISCCRLFVWTKTYVSHRGASKAFWDLKFLNSLTFILLYDTQWLEQDFKRVGQQGRPFLYIQAPMVGGSIPNISVARYRHKLEQGRAACFILLFVGRWMRRGINSPTPFPM